MTNRQIRSNAWGLFRENYLRMLPGMAVLGFIMIVPNILASLIASKNLNALVGMLVGTVFFAPIVLVGAAGFSLSIHRGGAPEIGRLFAHIRDIRRILKIWLAALAYGGANVLSSALSGLLQAQFSGSSEGSAAAGAMAVLTVANLLLVFAGIWLTFRLFLFSYAAADDPDASPSEWLRASWRAMKGNCGRLFRLMFSTFWPMLLVLIAAVIIFALGGADSALSLRSANARQTQNLFTSILLWLWMGYPQLAMAGFAEDRLADTKPHTGALA